VLVVASGIIQAYRGLSPETYGDVREALPVLDAELKPDDVLAVNEGALAISAYYQNTPIRWLQTSDGVTPPEAKHIVLTSAATDRTGDRREFKPVWLDRVDRWTEPGKFGLVFKSDKVIVLRRAD
jgi:hypothetical protein